MSGAAAGSRRALVLYTVLVVYYFPLGALIWRLLLGQRGVVLHFRGFPDALGIMMIAGTVVNSLIVLAVMLWYVRRMS